MFCTWFQGHRGLAVAFMYLILMFIQMCRLFYFLSELVLPNKSDSFPFFFISQWHWKLNTKLKVIHCTAKKIGRWTCRFERHSSWCQQREARDETRKRVSASAAFHVLPLQLHFQPTVDALSSLFGALESTKQKEKKKPQKTEFCQRACEGKMKIKPAFPLKICTILLNEKKTFNIFLELN